MSSKAKRQQPPDTLFYKFLIVQLDPSSNYSPLFAFRWIPGGNKQSDKLQEKDESDDKKIQQFCFPEAPEVLESMCKRGQDTAEFFSFILTDSLGSKSFAFCRRTIKKSDALCYCFISKFPYFKLFEKIISSIELKYEMKSKYTIHSMLQALVANPPPNSSTTIEVKTFASNSNQESFVFPFSKPRTKFDHVSYELLFKIKPAHLIKLFECILMESRIILLSSSTTVLSNTILALQSLVYPFVWQHIFVSILPISLMPYVAAPIPFLVGILESSLKLFYQQPTEQVILYNLDKLEFLIFDPNYKSLLPYHINAYINNSIQKLRVENTTYNSDLDEQIRKPFYSTIYHLFKGYFNYMVPTASVYHFKKDQFLDSTKGQTKTILEQVCNSQMVEMFLSEKEREFTAEGEINCSYLNEAKDKAEVIPEYITNSLKKHDCPVCAQTTISENTTEIHNMVVHTDCLKCKTCETSLVGVEREKVIIKKSSSNGERVKIYCSDCRVTFMNKSKIKFYAFLKNHSNNTSNSAALDAATSYSTFPSSAFPQLYKEREGRDSANKEIKEFKEGKESKDSKDQQQLQSMMPLNKQEILDFKFKNSVKGPPPKDLGRKSSSFNNIHSLLNNPTSTSSATTTTTTTVNNSSSSTVIIQQQQQQQQQAPPPVTLSKPASSSSSTKGSSFLANTPPPPQPITADNQQRKIAPLPPTPSERKERAIEQMIKRNINVPQFSSELSTSPSPQTNSIPLASVSSPQQQLQPPVSKQTIARPPSPNKSQVPIARPPSPSPEKPTPSPQKPTATSNPSPRPKPAVSPRGPTNTGVPSFSIIPTGFSGSSSSAPNTPLSGSKSTPSSPSQVLVPAKPLGQVTKKSGRPLPTPPIPPRAPSPTPSSQSTLSSSTSLLPPPSTFSSKQPPVISPRKLTNSSGSNDSVSNSSPQPLSTSTNSVLVKRPLPAPTAKVPPTSTTINFISVSNGEGGSSTETSPLQVPMKIKPTPPLPTYPPLSLSANSNTSTTTSENNGSNGSNGSQQQYHFF